MDKVLLHTCPICLKGRVIGRDKSTLLGLGTKRQFVCQTCHSVLQPVGDSYRYPTSSRDQPDTTKDLLAVVFGLDPVFTLQQLRRWAEDLKRVKKEEARQARRAAKGVRAQPMRMTWQEFETFVAKLFTSLGYHNVRLTPRAGDKGKDIVMEWADPLRGSRRLYVECKHWKAKSVGRREVQVLHSAVVANPGVEEGVIVTTGTFTEGAVAYARQVGVIQLTDGNTLHQLMAKAGL